MAKKPNEPAVRIIGSRELHLNLPVIMRDLEDNESRYVLTVHGKPKAVILGAATYLALIQGRSDPTEAMVGLQLSALLGIELDESSSGILRERLEPTGGTQPACDL